MAMHVVGAGHYVVVMVHVMVMVHRPAAVVNLEADHHTNRHCNHQAPLASLAKQQSRWLLQSGLL